MPVRRVYTVGETLMDIVFKDNVPVAAKAGGSMLNASVSLGRLGVQVSFVSESGNDQVGEIVNDFLNLNNVDTSHVYRFTDGKSALALAFLDQDQKASYSFYKSYPAERLRIDIPPIEKDDILMFGSYFGIAPEIRSFLTGFIAKARESGAFIIYDPNFRNAHLQHLQDLMPYLLENFSFADIIKGSDEDFQNIFQTVSAEETFDKLNDSAKILIYSRGSDGVDFISRNSNFHVKANILKPLSTIGAGDNFNAGIAFGLIKLNISRTNLQQQTKENFEKIVRYGVDFASEVCLSYENYISESFARKYSEN